MAKTAFAGGVLCVLSLTSLVLLFGAQMSNLYTIREVYEPDEYAICVTAVTSEGVLNTQIMSVVKFRKQCAFDYHIKMNQVCRRPVDGNATHLACHDINSVRFR